MLPTDYTGDTVNPVLERLAKTIVWGLTFNNVLEKWAHQS